MNTPFFIRDKPFLLSFLLPEAVFLAFALFALFLLLPIFRRQKSKEWFVRIILRNLYFSIELCFSVSIDMVIKVFECFLVDFAKNCMRPFGLNECVGGLRRFVRVFYQIGG